MLKDIGVSGKPGEAGRGSGAGRGRLPSEAASGGLQAVARDVGYGI